MRTVNYLEAELYDLIKKDAAIFEFIQSGSLDGMWYWDLENFEQEWLSPKFWETLGYDPSVMQHLASEWQDIIFEEDKALALDNFEKHCADPNYPYDQIVRYKHKNGSTVWIRCRGLAIRDEKGKAVRMLGAHMDITELKRAEKEISRLTDEYEIMFNGTQDAMVLVNVLSKHKFSYVRNNLAHQKKTGISLEEMANKSPQALFGKKIGDVVAGHYQECVDCKTSITYEDKQSLECGERIWLTTLTPISKEGVISHIVVSSTDITERKELELELEKYAYYDKLTGLPNRRLFFERLDRIVLESERDKHKFALLFIDLDEFKDINDVHGHRIGDEVLIEVGKRLSKSIRKSDSVARMGGDEFTVIVRKVDDKHSLDRLVMKIHASLKENIQIGSIACPINSSIGIAIYPDNGLDSESLLRNADTSMYEVKRDGKGGYKSFTD